MVRILAISSQVVFGPVGNTAAVPALQAMGHEVMQVPTILLSNHPGHGKPEGLAIDATLLRALLRRVDEVGGLNSCYAVMTGYFANPSQVEYAAEKISELRSRNLAQIVLVDPVIGDHGKLYVSEPTAEAIRDKLIPLATVATPNVFELGWLTQTPIHGHDDAVGSARKLGTREVIVTSVHASRGEIETVLVTSEAEVTSSQSERRNVPNGTGDFLAGLYLASRVNSSAETSFLHAMSILSKAIAISAGSPVLAVAEALHGSEE